MDQGRICRGRRGRDKPASWYERSGNMAHAPGVEGVQMAISFTVIEGCANLGTCLQVECMISLSLAVIYLLALTLNVSNIRPMVNIVRHYMLHYILCLSVEKNRIFILMSLFMAWRSHYDCL